MFAIMPSPVFTFDTASSSLYRPAVPSPLSSSSPIRPSSPPLSPRSSNSLSSPQRHTQSSPLQPTSTSSKFRFAARTPRPNPVVQKREDAQEGRRRLFLKNVRERRDEKRWERRGGEQELLKLEWLRLNREFRQTQEARLAQFDTDEEIENAARLQEEMASALDQGGADDDDAMIDALAQEEAEMEALVTSMSEESAPWPSSSSSRRDIPEERPDSPQFSDDDDDYDSLFMDFVAQEDSPWNQRYEGGRMCFSQDMDMS